MQPRISIITLGVKDIRRSIEFYHNKLGFPLSSASQGDIAFFAMGGVVLALYPEHLLAEDAQVALSSREGFKDFTLAHNVQHKEDVEAVLQDVEKAGGKILKPAEDVFWGGRSGYFADPDGHAWEVAWNPHFPLDIKGDIILP